MVKKGHKVRVNPAFRGELTLEIYATTLKGGNVIFLTDDQFNNSSVRAAIGRKYLIEEKEDSDGDSDSDLDGDCVEEEEFEEPTRKTNIKPRPEVKERMVVEQEDIDPRDFEEESNPVVWDADNQVMLDVREGAKKALSQLNGKMEMDIKTGEKIDLTKDNKPEPEPKPKIRVKKAVKNKASKSLKKAKRELDELAKSNILPIPNVGDIDLVQDGEISFVDQEQKTEEIKSRLKIRAQKKLKNNEEIG